MSISYSQVKVINWIHIALLLFSFHLHSSEKKKLRDDDFQSWQVLTSFVLTLTGNYSIVNTQFSKLSIHSHMYAQTMTVYTLSNSPESNLALHNSFGLWWWVQTILYFLILSTKLEKIIVNSHKQWEYKHTHLLHIEHRDQYYFAAMKQTISWEQYHPVGMLSSQWDLSPGPDDYLLHFADLT